jgi:hypothetical protein
MLGWGIPAKRFSWVGVELPGSAFEVFRSEDGQVRALGNVLPQYWNGPRKLDTESRYPSLRSCQMHAKNMVSHSDVANCSRKASRRGQVAPKRRGRPPTDREDSPLKSELETLRTENERIRAEVAYLGKLRALKSQERR